MQYITESSLDSFEKSLKRLLKLFDIWNPLNDDGLVLCTGAYRPRTKNVSNMTKTSNSLKKLSKLINKVLAI